MSTQSCSNVLVQADHFFDYIPIASSVTNLVDLFQKTVFIPCMSTKCLGNCHYFVHLKIKSFIRCLTLLIPFLGNLIIWIIDPPRITPAAFSRATKARELSKKLTKLKDDNESFPSGPYYRSGHVLANLRQALELYANGYSLSHKFTPSEYNGHMGHLSEPDTLKETFEDALKPSSHGGFQQTIKAIKEKPQHPSHLIIVENGEEITKLIRDILSSKRVFTNSFHRQ